MGPDTHFQRYIPEPEPEGFAAPEDVQRHIVRSCSSSSRASADEPRLASRSARARSTTREPTLLFVTQYDY